ncbi:MAG TPA: hypothetical protein VGP35_03235 [Terriglobales bacterium]|jgi:hypothetical protein|nr:hypothetical protein [Terriglobales bacterium]
MDVGTIVAWVQLVLWAFAVVAAAIKIAKDWKRGGFAQVVPQKGVYILLLIGLAVSGISLYFNQHPRVVQVEKIVEKLVPQVCLQCQTCPQSPTANAPNRVRGHQDGGQPALVIPPNTTISATTKAPDSAAVGINTGTVTVNPPVNPNAMTVTYDCVGTEKDSGRSENSLTLINVNPNKETPSLIQMEKLNNSKDYSGLLEVCEGKIKSVPQWLTPYLFCSLGYLASGNVDKARDVLKEYDSKTGPAYSGEPCKQASDFLHSHL